MGASTARGAPEKKAPGEGFRVFRVELNRRVRRELAKLHQRLAARDPSLPKSAFRYLGSWEEERAVVLELREQAGKRTPPRRDPPYHLLVKITKDGKRIHGSDSVPVVIDLGRGELRIPCAGIRVKLQPSLLKALEGELRLAPKPEFIVQLTCRGRLRIVAFRSPPKWWLYREECSDFDAVRLEPPVRVVGVDVNSVYGIAAVVFDLTDGNRVRVPKSPMRWQPPNDTLFLTMAAILRKIAQGLPPEPPRDADEEEQAMWFWALERVRRLERRVGALTTERADRLRCQLEQAARIARRRWAQKLLGELRRLVRGANGRAVVAIDVPDPDSLRNSRLQKTYLRVEKLVKNLCRYEGALYRRVRASGRVCPLCSRWCEEVEHRYYQCPSCGIVVDRDYGGAFNAGLEALPPLLAEELRKWLRSHPKALARNYNNPAGRGKGNRRAQLRRAPLPGTPAGRASPFGGAPGGLRARGGDRIPPAGAPATGAEGRVSRLPPRRPAPMTRPGLPRGGRRAGPEA
ncbi:MAG: zinc ribbon domain-containing protein [Thermofilum sp.]